MGEGSEKSEIGVREGWESGGRERGTGGGDEVPSLS